MGDLMNEQEDGQRLIGGSSKCYTVICSCLQAVNAHKSKFFYKKSLVDVASVGSNLQGHFLLFGRYLIVSIKLLTGLQRKYVCLKRLCLGTRVNGLEGH